MATELDVYTQLLSRHFKEMKCVARSTKRLSDTDLVTLWFFSKRWLNTSDLCLVIVRDDSPNTVLDDKCWPAVICSLLPSFQALRWNTSDKNLFERWMTNAFRDETAYVARFSDHERFLRTPVNKYIVREFLHFTARLVLFTRSRSSRCTLGPWLWSAVFPFYESSETAAIIKRLETD